MRLARLVAAGLVAGVFTGFVVALLRPRRPTSQPPAVNAPEALAPDRAPSPATGSVVDTAVDRAVDVRSPAEPAPVDLRTDRSVTG